MINNKLLYPLVARSAYLFWTINYEAACIVTYIGVLTYIRLPVYKRNLV